MLDRFSTPVQLVVAAFGAAFIGAAIVGFLPGLTTDFGDLSFAGKGSEAEALGILQVSVLHNAVHLLFGIAGLVLALSWRGARVFLLDGGLVYGALGCTASSSTRPATPTSCRRTRPTTGSTSRSR